MKQKLSTLFVAMLTGLAAWAHDFEVDGIYFTITSSTDLTVSVSYRGYSSSSYPNEYSGAVVIPESVTYNGESYSVTGIYYEAFRDCSMLTSVVIPSSVTSIGMYAFHSCSGLTSVVIPSSVTGIGMYAFEGCSGLTYNEYENGLYLGNTENPYLYLTKAKNTNITSCSINDNTKNIYSNAFNGCSGLTSVVIPSSVTSIDYQAFYGCSRLTSVVIPNGVTSIGSYAFYGCSGLTSVVIPSSVTEIGSSAFYNVTKAFILTNTAPSIVSGAFDNCKVYYTANNDSYGISGTHKVYSLLSSMFEVDGVKYIPTSMSQRTCDMVDVDYSAETVNSAIIIPENVIYNSKSYSVTSINDCAFYGCGGLTNVVIPSSVTEVGDYAFNGCTSIKNLTIEDGSETLSLGYNSYVRNGYGKGLFYDCPLESVYLGRNISYNSNNNYGYSPFCNKSGITELTIGEQVTSIGSSVFSGCSGLTSVVIPSSVTTIGSSAFYGCSGLTSVVIPSSVTSIGESAFYNVKKAFFLTNTMPSIGRFAFCYCTIYYTANNDSYGISCTHKVYSLLSSMFEVDGVKYIPTSMTQRTCDMVDVDYTAESVNSAIGPTVKYTNSTGRQYDFKVNNVNMYAGYGCKALSDLVLKNDGEIETYAFYGCSSAASITVSNNGNVGNNAFSDCSGAREIKLGDKITSIGSSCFSGCSSLLNITIPKLITTINPSTFEGCSSMTSVTLNNAVTSIGSDAFKNCSKLASLTIPANVASIASGAFDGCTSIGDLTFEDSETAINLACKFVGGKNLHLGRNVTYSMSNASPFSGNNVLETVMTNMNITSVPNYEFYNCKNLHDVYLSDAVTTIGTYAFSGDIALANFEVGMSVESIGAEAFSDCTALWDFKSHSMLPAAVGTEALDDIDKLECTLHVPEGTKAEYEAADQWKEFWIEDDLLPRYKVIVTVDPECAGMGTVKGSNGYDKNTTATLEAVPDEWHRFVEWSDGNKQNPRTMTVTEAVNLTAKFAYRYYIKTQPAANNISVALSEMVSGVEYKWYVSETEGKGGKDITNDLQSTGSYVWTKSSAGVWTSGNKGRQSSSSTLSMNITAKAGDKLTFDYSVSSESGYDYLNIYLGSNQIGNSYSGSASGTYEYTFTSDMNTTLKFVYSKDNSNDNGSDQATISNVIIEDGAAAILLDGETSSAVTASGLETEMYYYCEVIMPDGTILTSDQVQYTGTAGSTYTISIASSDNGMVLGAGTYVAGTTITIEAIATDGYEFVRWSDGNTDNPRVITVDANMNLTAEYKEATSTGISDIILSPAKEGIYDIMGRKLAAPQRGINIINGKKVIVR